LDIGDLRLGKEGGEVTGQQSVVIGKKRRGRFFIVRGLSSFQLSVFQPFSFYPLRPFPLALDLFIPPISQFPISNVPSLLET
jgi:hypothetical protein